MSSLSSSTEGAGALAGSLRAAGAALGELLEVNTAAGELVLGAATIPRRTGRLASTARVVGSVDGFELVAGGAAAPYAALVHARNPFLLDPLVAHEDDVLDHYLGHAERVLETIQGA